MIAIRFFLFSILFFALQPLMGQEKYNPTSNIYFSLHAGTFPIEDFLLSANVSAGYQINKWVGVGLSLGASAKSGAITDFTGLALQYRMVPTKKIVLDADIGLVLNHNKVCDFTCEYRYIKEPNPYFKVHVGFRLGKVFTLGAGGVFLPKARSELWWYDDMDTNNNPNWYLKNTVDHDFETVGFIVSLGVNIN